MKTSAHFRRRFAWLASALPLLLLLLVPICGALRIRTYATGQDPRIFISLAKGLLEHTKSLADVSSLVVPGWPLALAGVMRLFGMYAAFWVNLPLFMATLLLLAWLLSDLLGSFSRGAFAAVVCTLLLLGGHENNPHFLLWSFRQTPIYFFSLLSLFAVRRAGLSTAVSRLRAFLWLCVSLLALAFATAVRETSPLVFPSIVLFLCFSPLVPAGVPVPPGARRFLLVSFFSICVAAALVGALLVVLTGFSPVNAQSAFFLEWLKAMFSQSFSQLPLWGMLRVLREEFAAPGLLFLSVGIPFSSCSASPRSPTSSSTVFSKSMSASSFPRFFSLLPSPPSAPFPFSAPSSASSVVSATGVSRPLPPSPLPPAWPPPSSPSMPLQRSSPPSVLGEPGFPAPMSKRF